MFDNERIDVLRRPLWDLARGRSSKDAFLTAVTMSDFLQAEAADVLACAVNEAIETTYLFARELAKNPACLGQAAYHQMSPNLSDAGKAMLVATVETLMAADVTKESSTPHEECHPWPAGLTAPKAQRINDGALLNALAEEVDAPVSEIASSAADVLINLSWGRARSDGETFRRLLDERSSELKQL